MFAYILAAMHLGLRHAVTSETIQFYSTRPKVLGQAWHMVEGLDPHGASSKAAQQCHYRPGVPTGGAAPPVLHYCIKAEVRDRGVGSMDQFDKRQRFRDGRVPAGLRGTPRGVLPTGTSGSWRCSTTRARRSRPASALSCSGPWPRPSGRPWSTTSSRPAAMAEAAGGGGTGCRFAVHLVVAT